MNKQIFLLSLKVILSSAYTWNGCTVAKYTNYQTIRPGVDIHLTILRNCIYDVSKNAVAVT